MKMVATIKLTTPSTIRTELPGALVVYLARSSYNFNINLCTWRLKTINKENFIDCLGNLSDSGLNLIPATGPFNKKDQSKIHCLK